MEPAVGSEAPNALMGKCETEFFKYDFVCPNAAGQRTMCTTTSADDYAGAIQFYTWPLPHNTADGIDCGLGDPDVKCQEADCNLIDGLCNPV